MPSFLRKPPWLQSLGSLHLAEALLLLLAPAAGWLVMRGLPSGRGEALGAWGLSVAASRHWRNG